MPLGLVSDGQVLRFGRGSRSAVVLPYSMDGTDVTEADEILVTCIELFSSYCMDDTNLLFCIYRENLCRIAKL